MNEQNKKNFENDKQMADYIRQSCKDVMKDTPVYRCLNEIADRLDPKPDHPTDGEIVECIDKNGYLFHGLADEEGVFRYKHSKRGVLDSCTNAWENIKSYRIINELKPGEISVKIPPVEEWPYSATHIDIQYYDIYSDEYVGDVAMINKFEAKELYKDR